MKYTEGAFRAWGYDLALSEFADRVFTMRQWESIKKIDGEASANEVMSRAIEDGRLLIKDIIADAAFETALTRPETLDVLATPNLNGDYLSDALSAQAGGLGIAPGANINYETGMAIFEATHGTAPALANLDKANPCSLLLSAALMLDYIGWPEAAALISRSIEAVLQNKTVTADLHALLPESTLLSTSQFGDELIKSINIE
jgi:isocitrate dehydrogenase